MGSHFEIWSEAGWKQQNDLAAEALSGDLPPGFVLPEGLHTPRVCLPGVLAVSAPPYAAPQPGAAPPSQPPQQRAA